MVTVKRLCLGLVLLAGAGTQIWAESQALDLNGCFKAAVVRSEILADQAEQITQAEEHYRQALGNFYPYIYGAGYVFQQQNPGGNLPASNPGYQQLAKVGINQPLFRGFREYASIYQNRDVITAQKEAKQWAGIQLYLEVSQSFYSVLALQKDLAHLDTQIDLYEQRIRDLNARIRIGRSRPSEVLTIQAAQAGLKAERQQLTGQLETMQEMLAFLTGLDPETAIVDQTPYPSKLEPLDTFLSHLESRPDVLTAQKQIDATRANITIAKSGHWPTLDFYGNYYLNRQTGSTVSNVDWDAEVALTLPIFTGGITVSKVAEAESQVHQSELALSRIRRAAQQDIRDAYKTFKSDLAQVIAQQDAVVLSEKNYQAELKDYNYGLVTNLDVLAAMSSYQDSVRALDKLKFSVMIDHQHLDAVTAQLPAGLEGN
jgi:outer membrane protein